MFELLRKTRQQNDETKGIFLPISHALRLLQSRNSITKIEIEAIADEAEQLEPAWEHLHNRSLAMREQLSATQDKEVAALKKKCASFIQLVATERKKLLQSIIFCGPVGSYKFLSDKANPYAAMDVARSSWLAFKDQSLQLLYLGELYDMSSVQFAEIELTLSDLQLAKTLWDNAAAVGFTLDRWMATPFASVDPNLLSDEARKFCATYATMPSNTRQCPFRLSRHFAARRCARVIGTNWRSYLLGRPRIRCRLIQPAKIFCWERCFPLAFIRSQRSCTR
jgi:hypothetical protein